MTKYNINYIFERENDINEIFVRVLKKELKKYILMICKNKKCEVPSLCTYLSQERRKSC